MLLCRTRKDSDLILRFSVAQPLQLLFFGAVSCFRCIRFNFEATICLRGAELYPRRCLFASLSYEHISYIATPRQFRARSTLRSPARHGFPGEPAFKLMRALSLAVRRLRARTTDAAKRYGAMGSARSSCLWYAGWCAYICHRSLMISPYPNDESCGNDQCRTSILIAHSQPRVAKAIALGISRTGREAILRRRYTSLALHLMPLARAARAVYPGLRHARDVGIHLRGRFWIYHRIAMVLHPKMPNYRKLAGPNCRDSSRESEKFGFLHIGHA